MTNTSENGEEEGGLAFGKEFAGRYHVGEQIGSGGYGKVYRARETELDRDVALKVLDPSDVDQEHKRKRFLREARLVAGLEEPQTITLYDYGEAEGLLYLAFEYVEGETLGSYVSNQGGLKPYEVLKLLEQILDSLQEAHEQGILHRDIKPSNIMVYEHERRGLEVKILDFGIGKFLEEEKERQETKLTREGSMMGTPRYMSPEQMKGEELGPEADLWAVGVVALEALLGEHVIDSTQPMVIQSEILEKQQEPFVVPADQDVPVFFRRLLEKLMRKSRSQRYGSAKQVQKDIAELRQQESSELGPSESDEVTEFEAANTVGEVPNAESGTDSEKVEESDADTVGAKPKNREREEEDGGAAVILAVGGLAVVVVGGAIGAWMSMSSEEEPTSRSAVAAKLKVAATDAEETTGETTTNETNETVRREARGVAERLRGQGQRIVGKVKKIGGAERGSAKEGKRSGGGGGRKGEKVSEKETAEGSGAKASEKGGREDDKPSEDRREKGSNGDGGVAEASGEQASELKKKSKKDGKTEKVRAEEPADRSEKDEESEDEDNSMKVWGVE